MENVKVHAEHSHSDGIYVLVWFALITLTALTATVGGINFGKLSAAIAVIIAIAKSYLVLTEFMHLRMEQKAFKIFVLVALMFLLISFTLLFSDYLFM